jgi:hypothetical protein
MICTGPGGTGPRDRRTISVAAASAPTANLRVRVNGGSWQSSLPNPIDASDDIDLQWNSSNASNCTATAGAGFSTGSGNPSSGVDSNVTIPAAGRSDTFTVRCTGSGGADTDSIQVMVRAAASAPPVPTAFFTGPSSPHSINSGDRVRLRYETTNADDCTIEVFESGVRTGRITFSVNSGNTPTAGDRRVGPHTVDTEYSIHCTNATGISPNSPDVEVRIVASPVVSLSANPTSGAAGYLTDVTFNAAGHSGTCDTGYSSGPLGNWGGTVVAGSGNQVISNVGPVGVNGVLRIWCDLNGNGGIDSGERATESLSITVTTISGCTDPIATNFNPLATVDDGSCVYPAAPTADLQIRINNGTPGPWLDSLAGQVRSNDTLELQWTGGGSAASCTATGGAGFDTFGALSGIDQVITPLANDSDTFTVDCDGASDSVSVSVAPNSDLTIDIIDYATSTTYDPATGNYDYVDVEVQVRNGPVPITDRFVAEFGIDRDDSDGIGPFTDTFTIDFPSGIGANTVINIPPDRVRFTDVPFDQAYVEAVVDPGPPSGGDIPETDESNNEDQEMVALLPPDVQMILTIDPEDLVRGGENAILDWDTVAYFNMQCTMTGPTLSVPAWNPAGPPPRPTGQEVVGPINSKSEYTLQCVEPRTNTIYTRQVSVETTGTIEEI